MLLVSELVTNAVVHGEPPISIDLEIAPPFLSVAVSDHGRGAPVLATPDELDGHGRGLQIVGQLADGWGIDWQTEGKCVWFQLDIVASPIRSVN